MSILFATFFMKINRISTDNQKYLKILSNIAKCPEKLYFLGKLPDDRAPTVAIVGTRKPSHYGKEVTYDVAYGLAKRGVIIVSGLALGIDAIAHQAALDAGGITIAILASGLDDISPKTNYNLAQKIIHSGGAIISEYPPGKKALPHQFLERNRIVSGLSDLILVTEAAIKSGTFSTVSHGLEQGKDISAIPGNITSTMSSGCNNLIKQGAHLVRSATDILELLGLENESYQKSLPLGSNELETGIIKLLDSGVRDGEIIRNTLDIPVEQFQSTMTMMEINEIVQSLGGDKWKIK